MHGVCRFILEGDRSFMPFEVNMPRLFETFVAEWLRVNALPGMTVRCQHKARLVANYEMEIRVDILICDKSSQKPVAVLDTKYKASELPAQDDITQIAFYAGELQVDHGMFVYPASVAKPFKMVHANKITIESLAFDIGQSLDAAGSVFLDSLKSRSGIPTVELAGGEQRLVIATSSAGNA